MKTSAECARLAEAHIAAYCQSAECQTPEDIRKACELLISKTARGIEKYNGNPVALDVLSRSLAYVATTPMPAGGVQ